MSKSDRTDPVMPSPDEEALDDHPGRGILDDPSCGPWVRVTLEEAAEMGLSCETWEEQKRFDRRRAGRAAP